MRTAAKNASQFLDPTSPLLAPRRRNKAWPRRISAIREHGAGPH
jgi:hypothetical protein